MPETLKTVDQERGNEPPDLFDEKAETKGHAPWNLCDLPQPALAHLSLHMLIRCRPHPRRSAVRACHRPPVLNDAVADKQTGP